MHTFAEHRLIFFEITKAVETGASGLVQSLDTGVKETMKFTQAALGNLNNTLSPSVAAEFAANPAPLLQSPQAAANVLSNLSLSAVPILGTLFAVAGIIGLTRYGFRKIGENMQIS